MPRWVELTTVNALPVRSGRGRCVIYSVAIESWQLPCQNVFLVVDTCVDWDIGRSRFTDGVGIMMLRSTVES